MNFWVDIESTAGVKQGTGPLSTVQSWIFTPAMDQAGTFQFTVSAADPKASLIQNKYVARCWGLIAGVITDLGAGIIDKVQIVIDSTGSPFLTVSGNDIMRELSYASVGTLQIGPSGAVTTGPADIMALASGLGWSLDTTSTDAHSNTLTAINYTFAGENILQALVKLSQLTGEHFRLGTGRKITWMQQDHLDSTMRAVQGGDPIGLLSNSGVCLITNLQELNDSSTLATRIYPSGQGFGSAKISLVGATVTLPAGYTLHASSNYISNDTAEAGFPGIVIVAPPQNFKNMADANTLAWAAYNWLRLNSVLYKSYVIDLANLNTILKIGQTIRVVYYHVVGGYVAVNINEDQIILTASSQIDNAGVRTVQITTATVDRYAQSDTSNISSAINQSNNLYNYPQPAVSSGGPSASSTVTSETGFGQAANAGSASTFSKGDHTHGTPPDNPVFFTTAQPILGTLGGAGAAMSIGTYTYDVQSYGVPSGAKAVYVRHSARWNDYSYNAHQAVFYYNETYLYNGVAWAVWPSDFNAAISTLRFEIGGWLPLESHHSIKLEIAGLNTVETFLTILGYQM